MHVMLASGVFSDFSRKTWIGIDIAIFSIFLLLLVILDWALFPFVGASSSPFSFSHEEFNQASWFWVSLSTTPELKLSPLGALIWVFSAFTTGIGTGLALSTIPVKPSDSKQELSLRVLFQRLIEWPQLLNTISFLVTGILYVSMFFLFFGEKKTSAITSMRPLPPGLYPILFAVFLFLPLSLYYIGSLLPRQANKYSFDAIMLYFSAFFLVILLVVSWVLSLTLA